MGAHWICNPGRWGIWTQRASWVEPFSARVHLMVTDDFGNLVRTDADQLRVSLG